MKIMSFNTQHCLNFLSNKIDFDAVASAIRELNPDIVGFNEMRDEGPDIEYEKQTAILSELTGMKYHYFAKAIEFGDGNPYGNSFISKLPIISAKTILVPDPNPKTGTGYYETRCLLKAVLEGGITVLVIHFGLNEDEQKNAVDTILKNLEDEKCILMGDFNARPDNEILKPIRERMKDTAECFDKPLLSFPSDNPKVKIDYIFVSNDIEVITADIPEVIVSDHRPHTAIVKVSDN